MIEIRFAFESDASDEGAGWYLDEITVVRDSITESPSPTIVQHPGDLFASPGDSVAFGIEVDGLAPFTYQWRLNGANIIGASSASLEIENVQAKDGGSYSVVIANSAGIASSNVANLTVELPLLPFTDDFENRGSLNSSSGLGIATNIGANLEPNEQIHNERSSGRSVWIQWLVEFDGVASLSTQGSNFDTVLAVYRGANLGILEQIIEDDDSGGFFTSEVVFNVDAGETLNIVVDGVGNSEGEIVFEWSLEASPETIPLITGQPQGAVYSGNSVTLEVEVDDSETVEIQWERNGITIPNATQSTLVFTTVGENEIGSYTALVSNGLRSIRSNPARLEIGTEPGEPTRNKYSELAKNEAQAIAKLGHTGLKAPPLSRLRHKGITKNNLVVSPGFVSLQMGRLGRRVLNNSASSTEAAEPLHGETLGGASRLLGLEIKDKGSIALDTHGSKVDTILALYRIVGGSWLETELVAENDDESDTSTESYLLTEIDSGLYLVVVDGKQGASGTININWVFGLPPKFDSAPPRNVELPPWQTALLEVQLEGTPTPEMRWFKDGEILRDQDQAILSISDLQPEHSGTYSVTASNQLGIATSTQLHLTVLGFKLTDSLLNPQGQYGFTFTAEIGQDYLIEASLDLVRWQRLHQSTAKTGTVSFVDLAAPSIARRFYRVILFALE